MGNEQTDTLAREASLLDPRYPVKSYELGRQFLEETIIKFEFDPELLESMLLDYLPDMNSQIHIHKIELSASSMYILCSDNVSMIGEYLCNILILNELFSLRPYPNSQVAHFYNEQ